VVSKTWLVWCACCLAACTDGDPKEGSDASDASTQAPRTEAGLVDAASELPASHADAMADARVLEHVLEAGSPDAAALSHDASAHADAASDAGTSGSGGCTDAGFLFCEGFEGATEGALPSGWTVLSGWGGGTPPKVISAERHSGAHSLETGIASTGQSRVQHSLSALGAAANKHWGRVFYKAKTPAPPPSSGVLHNTLVALRGTDESRVVDTVINTAGAHQFLYNIPDDSFGKGSSYDYHSYDGAWHCAEWYVDAAAKSYRFFFEGKEVTSIAFTEQTGAHLGGFTNIVLGFIGYQMPVTPYDGWFDDLALAESRIGCD
jgi:hypothetical protein